MTAAMRSTTRRCRHLLIGASVAALTLASAGAAEADPADRPTWVSIEGAWDFLYGDAQGWADTFLPGPGAFARDTVRPDEGWHGKAGLVTPLGDTPYDFGLFVRYGETEKGKDTPDGIAARPVNGVAFPAIGYTNPGQGATHEEEHFLADFEARRDLGLGDSGGTRVTGIVGVRLAHFEAQTDESFNTGVAVSYIVRNKRTSRFYGAGPLVGFETVTPLGESFAFELGADAALLFGDRHRKVKTVNNTLNPTLTTDSHRFRVVPTVGASASFSYMPAGMGGMKISLGVTADAWFGAHDQHVDSPTPGSLDANDNGETFAERYNIRPFLRLAIPLN